MNLYSVLGFLLTIGVLIVVHEFAHYRVAVAFGVKVDRFSIGFGRVLWRRQPTPGGTEFVLSALPLGGYVRWIDDREVPPITEAERPGMFASKPLWQRALIVAAGPVSNLVLAVLLFAAAHWIGIDEPKAVLGTPPAASLAQDAGVQAGDLVTATGLPNEAAGEPDWTEVRAMSDLTWALTQGVVRREPLMLRLRGADGRSERVVELSLDRLPPGDLDAAMAQRIGLAPAGGQPVMGDVNASGPAAEAGLQKGDKILRINGEPVEDSKAALALIRGDVNGGVAAAQTWMVERRGALIELTVRPRVVVDGQQQVGRIDAIITAPPPEMTRVRYSLVDGLVNGARRTWELSAMTLKILGRIIVGKASFDNLSGPVSIGKAAGESLHLGLGMFLNFMALVSVSLGVLNLLPVPVLDGGHLMYYIFEALTGRPVSGMWLRWLQGGGFLILLLLMSLALYNDLVRHAGLH